jgi:FkbM family methyltransferase
VKPMPLDVQLEALLSEPVSAIVQRERDSFDELTAPKSDRLVLFGAGGLGRKTAAGLRRVGVQPLAFADNNPALWSTEIEGVPVLSPRDAATKYGRRAAFVVTIWRGESSDVMSERRQHLLDVGCETVVSFAPLFWKHPDVFLPHYAFDLPQRVIAQADAIRDAFSLWADDASRAEFVAQIRWRMLADFAALPSPVDHEIYFPDDLVDVQPDEVFVDCGAYDGDTLQSLLSRDSFSDGRIVAFEPDGLNFGQLRRYVATLPASLRERIALRQAAVGARHCQVEFDATGTEASAVGTGSVVVDCVTLDEALSGHAPTYVKMDIEGSEMDALEGAAGIIKKSQPMLAICAYHRQDDCWRIPLALAALTDKYRFYLRPHLLEVWDLVCYAVPVARLK